MMIKQFLLTCLAAGGLSFAAQQPNVIFILADDLGYGDLSCYGQQKFETPNIDRLAAQGMRFTNLYSGSTVCAPSRCSLLTGKHTGHSAVRGNKEHRPEGQEPMPADTFTAAHLFRQAGYATGIFGKWGLGYPGSVSDPLNMGFDRFYGYNCQRLAHNYYPYFLSDDDHRDVLWKNFGTQRGTYAPDRIHEEALKFIRANREKPFFCYYAAIQPHAEMLAPEKNMEAFRGKFPPEKAFAPKEAPEAFRQGAYAPQPEPHAAFAAMVTILDSYVGEVLAELDELGLRENTLVIFSSDNGPHIEGGHQPQYFNSNGAFRGVKRDLYDGGIHVPFIASWPGKIPEGVVTDHLAAFWDFLPTMAELTAQPLPEETDGISMLPALLGKPGQAEHNHLYWEFDFRNQPRRAVRKDSWKAVQYHPDRPVELYDLSKDPGEEVDVSVEYPEVAAELERLMNR